MLAQAWQGLNSLNQTFSSKPEMIETKTKLNTGSAPIQFRASENERHETSTAGSDVSENPSLQSSLYKAVPIFSAN